MPLENPELFGLVLGGFFLTIFLISTLISYIYLSAVTMTLSKKLKRGTPWVAWVPIAQFFVLAKVAKTPWWSALAYILLIWTGIIPLAIMIWWFWNLAEARKYPGWISLLLLVPVIQIIIPGLIAWVDQK